MSINHFSSDLPEALWWTQNQQKQPMMEEQPPKAHKTLWSNHQVYHHPTTTTTTPMFCTQNSTFNFDLNQEDDEESDNKQFKYEREEEETQFQEQEIPKESMFEKPLTPSDVGKLNRLVIPKQHAEKYFPLGGGGSGGDSSEKGLLLSFEDESGKSWRFRYSYWNSSQSYVLTKGWSRYVKEKRLDAGDIVFFERHQVDSNRLFIGWRRRSSITSGVAQPGMMVVNGGGGDGWTRMYYSGHPYPNPNGPPLPYQPDCLHSGSVMQNQTITSGNSKTLRLFGVNMECQAAECEPSTSTPEDGSNQVQAQYQYYPSNHHNHHMVKPYVLD